MSETDAAWFKRNGNANCRVRPPRDGEVAEIARRFGAGPYYEIAMAGGVLPPPALNFSWWVMVIKVDQDTQIRMLTLRDVDDKGSPTREFTIYTIASFERVAIDRR